MELIDGNEIASAVIEELSERVASLATTSLVWPSFG